MRKTYFLVVLLFTILLLLFSTSCSNDQLNASKESSLIMNNTAAEQLAKNNASDIKNNQTINSNATAQTKNYTYINLTTPEPVVVVKKKKNATVDSIVPIIPIQDLVTVVAITENADACIISVNGTKGVINKGKTERIAGINVTVYDIIGIHSQYPDVSNCKIMVNGLNKTTY